MRWSKEEMLQAAEALAERHNPPKSPNFGPPDNPEPAYHPVFNEFDFNAAGFMDRDEEGHGRHWRYGSLRIWQDKTVPSGHVAFWNPDISDVRYTHGPFSFEEAGPPPDPLPVVRSEEIYSYNAEVGF